MRFVFSPLNNVLILIAFFRRFLLYRWLDAGKEPRELEIGDTTVETFVSRTAFDSLVPFMKVLL